MEFDKITTDPEMTLDKLLDYKMQYSEIIATQINNLRKVNNVGIEISKSLFEETLLTITELSIQLGIIESAISVMEEQ